MDRQRRRSRDIQFRSPESGNPDKKVRWDRLLTGWADFDRNRTLSVKRALKSLLPGYQAALLRVRKAQVRTAEEFNLLGLLNVADDELRHSTILAWLLDREQTHGQMESGFRILLQELSLDPRFAERRYQVRREVSGEKSRIDVEISSEGSFLIHFENKIWSQEGDDQLQRQSEDLARRAAQLGVAMDRVHAYYLTPSGGLPARPGLFAPLGWRTIARVFERFSTQAQAEPVKWFARHYAQALTALVVDPGEKEDS